MKILLVGIYDTNTVSLAPQLLRAVAMESAIALGHEIETQEFSIFSDDAEAITVSIQRFNPDIVGFSCYIWNHHLIRQITPRLNCTIILGGPQVTGLERQLLQTNPEIDIIVTGEGEQSFLDLLAHFAGRKPLREIAGITTAAMQNPPSLLLDLQTPVPLYEAIFKRHADITWVSFETSRGCPMGCGYCTWGQSRKMRYYPLEHVLSELDVILGNPGIREIYLCDSSLLYNKERAKAILDHIAVSGSNKIIRYEFSPEQVDDEIIERMIRLPANEFNFGLQTINPRALTVIGRSLDRKLFELNLRKLVQAFPGAQITIDLIYGLPGDDIQGYLSSMNYVMALPGVSRILTNPLLVLPGSRFFCDQEKHGMVIADDGSFMQKENSTFTASQMVDARRYSFYLNLLYLNGSLKGALLELAGKRQLAPAEMMIEFFSSLPAELLGDEYPYTIPSTQAGFALRNRVFGRILRRYSEIVEAYKSFANHRADQALGSYRQSFTGQFHKLLAYAAETAGQEAGQEPGGTP